MQIDNPEFWIKFDEKRQYFDSIPIDKSKIKNYINIISDGTKYEVKELGLNLIQPSRQLDNSTHFDECDFSFVTYLNDDFVGGDFIYYVDGTEYRITPKKGLTIKLKNKIRHRVDKVIDGKRFSLYVFLNYPKKIKSSLI
jgi:hypothetical protein